MAHSHETDGDLMAAPDNAPRAKDVAADLVSVINGLGLTGVVAVRNSAPYYKLESLSSLKVDVLPTQLKRPRKIKRGCDKAFSIDVLIQKRAVTQDEHDTLTDLVDDIQLQVLQTSDGTPRRLLSGLILVEEGPLSADDIYEEQSKYEENRFYSRLRFTMTWNAR